MIVYCATTNPGKVAEYKLVAEHFGVGNLQLEILPGLREIPAPDETGSTFEANAILKAVYYSRHATEYVFADDSGLEVDALGGAPGVYSARYAGAGAGDKANNRLLLANMSGETNRAARFVCAIALARAGKAGGTFRGTIEGVLLHEERGEGGFGYDPLFYYPPYECTLAQIGAARKMDVSHRGKAIEKMLLYLAERRAFA